MKTTDLINNIIDFISPDWGISLKWDINYCTYYEVVDGVDLLMKATRPTWDEITITIDISDEELPYCFKLWKRFQKRAPSLESAIIEWQKMALEKVWLYSYNEKRNYAIQNNF